MSAPIRACRSHRSGGGGYAARELRSVETAAVVLFAACIGTRLGGETAVRYVDDLATAGAALLATALCVRAAARHAERLRLFWWLLAGACCAWALGELIWGLYDLVLGSAAPVPSWADAAYLAAIPPAVGALLAHPAMRGRAIGKLRSVLDGLVIAAALFFLGWTLVLEPLGRASDLTTLGGAVTIAYPLGEIVIVFLVVLVLRGMTSEDRLDLWCLLGGLLAITLSDSVFGYLVHVKHYATGNAVDAGWLAGYLGIALAAHFARPQLASVRRQAVPALTSAAVIGPFLPLFAALFLAAIKIELGHHLDGVAVTTVFALVSLVLIRQAVLLIDLLAPQHRPELSTAQRLVDALGKAVPEPRREHSHRPRRTT